MEINYLDRVVLAMKNNQKIKKEDKEKAIAILKEQQEAHVENRRAMLVEKWEEIINGILDYKPRRYQVHKSGMRKAQEISRDIEAVTEMIRQCRLNRNYDQVATWMQNRDELEREFYAVVSGQEYYPAFEKPERFFELVPQGIQQRIEREESLNAK